MNLIRSFSLRSLVVILVIMAILSLFFVASSYVGWSFVFSKLPITMVKDTASPTIELKEGWNHLMPALQFLNPYFIAATICIFMLFALLLWLIVRRIFVRLIEKAQVPTERQRKKPAAEETSPSKMIFKNQPLPGEEKGAIDQKEESEIRERLYLHILSVLQRDGRLLDFFSEDLGNYEDSQIGAAVRNIHENCKKSLYKYLKPAAVIDKTEGEQVTVPKNFDAAAVKLTGNLSGAPPFQGILRHKGWQVSKLDLPILTAGQNPKIITPAEVEIL